MAKRKSSATATVASAPRITAAAAPAAPATITGSAGVRSAPTQNLWRSWRSETPAQAAERVQKSRFLQEALPFIGYLVSQLPEEAIGDGLVPTSGSSDPDFKAAATAYFDQWADSTAIDIRRRFKFYGSQHLVGQTMVGDGEIFVLKVKDDRPQALARPLTDTTFRRLQLQFLTRDQLGNAGFRDLVSNGSEYVWDAGIQFDRLDIPRNYRILKQSAGSLSLGMAREYDQVPASQMLHIFADRHFNQRHGTPWIFGGGEKSAFDSIDLAAVEKFGDKIRAYFLGCITTPSGNAPASVRPAVRKGQSADADGNAVDDGLRYIELAGGVSLPVLKQGEEVEFFEGQLLSFAEIIQRCWSEAVLCLKFPPEYLLNIAGLGSASIRMVLRKVLSALNRIRRPVREQYCQAVWEFVIGDAVERGLPWTKDKDGKIVDDWRKVTWKGAMGPSIDAGRDERAEQNKLTTFTGTVEQYCDALGLDGATVRHTRLDEIADNIAYGATKGLPWFMCIDAMQVQAMTGLATSLGVDISDLVAKLTKPQDTPAGQ